MQNISLDEAKNKLTKPTSDFAVIAEHDFELKRADQISPNEIKAIRALSKNDLHSAPGQQIKLERTQLMRVIYHMREVDRRRLWAEMGYSSFVKYCVDQFGMSETSFYRRQAILQTMRDIPEVEAKILDGTLNSSTVSKVATFVRRETKFKGRKVTIDEKREILKGIENKSERAVERELAARSPELPPPDRKRFISQNQILNEFACDIEVEEMATRLKEVLAASLPKNFSQNDFLKKVYTIALEQADPLRKIARAEKRKPKMAKIERSQVPIFLNGSVDGQEIHEPVFEPKVIVAAADKSGVRAAKLKPPALPKLCVKNRFAKKPRKYIKVKTDRTLFRRDECTCVFVSPVTGIKCNSKFAVQKDHIQGFALGGSDELENLRLYCAAHNQLAAIQTYGSKYMSKFVPSLK